MAIHIDNEKLQELVSYLTTKLPYTIRILGLAQNVLCGRVDGQLFAVDRWPQPSAIVVKTVPGKLQFDRPRMEVWGESAADLCRLLSATSDWTETFTLTGVNIDFKEALAKIVPGSLDFSPNDQYLYVWQPDNPVPEISELPDGMRLGKLVPEQAVQMTANWRYASDAAATERMLRRLIQSMSSSAITDRSGRLLGYCTQYHYGAFGFLNVDPEYRRRGFGRLLLADILRQVRSAGARPFLMVDDFNTAGQTLVTSVGFQRTDCTIRFAKYSAASK